MVVPGSFKALFLSLTPSIRIICIKIHVLHACVQLCFRAVLGYTRMNKHTHTHTHWKGVRPSGVCATGA